MHTGAPTLVCAENVLFNLEQSNDVSVNASLFPEEICQQSSL